MSALFKLFVGLNAGMLRVFARRRSPRARSGEKVRILCLTTGGVAEMLDTFPLLKALRRHYSRALIAVACDPAVAPIAQTCRAIRVILAYRRSFLPWLGSLRNGAQFQGFDWVIVATPGYNRRLAVLSQLSNARVRIGFGPGPGRSSAYYTDSVDLPAEAKEEHRVETLMRLLKPLGFVKQVEWSLEPNLRLPHAALALAEEVRSQAPFTRSSSFILIKIGSRGRSYFREEDYIELVGRILASTHFAIGLLAAPADAKAAGEIAICMGSDRIAVVEPMSPIELAAVLQLAAFLVTPQDEAAHLAAAVGTASVILWPKTPLGKAYPRGKKQIIVPLKPGERSIPADRVWQAVQPLLPSLKESAEKLAEVLELPPSDEFMA